MQVIEKERKQRQPKQEYQEPNLGQLPPPDHSNIINAGEKKLTGTSSQVNFNNCKVDEEMIPHYQALWCKGGHFAMATIEDGVFKVNFGR